MNGVRWSPKCVEALRPWRTKSLTHTPLFPIYGRIVFEEKLDIPPALNEICCQGKKLKYVLVEIVDMQPYFEERSRIDEIKEQQRIEIECGQRTDYALPSTRHRRGGGRGGGGSRHSIRHPKEKDQSSKIIVSNYSHAVPPPTAKKNCGDQICAQFFGKSVV